jgi:hypothetical protein
MRNQKIESGNDYSFYVERIVFYINSLREAYRRINSLENENADLREKVRNLKVA